MPFGLLNTYVAAVCDAVPLLFTYFTTEGFTNLVKVLKQLSVHFHFQLLSHCHFTRHTPMCC
jgi:hypothetical protein